MNTKYRAAILVLSDKGSRGERWDLSGPLARKILDGAGYNVVSLLVLPDERKLLEDELKNICDKGIADLVITCGGTGFSARDVTPEATLAVCERNAPGLSEALRANGLKHTVKAALSRGVSVIRKKTLIVNLPGSPKAVQENLECLIQYLPHALDIMTGHAGECARAQ